MHSNFLRTMKIGPFQIEMSYAQNFDENYFDEPEFISVYGTMEDPEDLTLIQTYFEENFPSIMWKKIIEKIAEIDRLKYEKSEEMFLRIMEDMKEYLDIMAKYP